MATEEPLLSRWTLFPALSMSDSPCETEPEPLPSVLQVGGVAVAIGGIITILNLASPVINTVVRSFPN